MKPAFSGCPDRRRTGGKSKSGHQQRPRAGGWRIRGRDCLSADNFLAQSRFDTRSASRRVVPSKGAQVFHYIEVGDGGSAEGYTDIIRRAICRGQQTAGSAPPIQTAVGRFEIFYWRTSMDTERLSQGLHANSRPPLAFEADVSVECLPSFWLRDGRPPSNLAYILTMRFRHPITAWRVLVHAPIRRDVGEIGAWRAAPSQIRPFGLNPRSTCSLSPKHGVSTASEFGHSQGDPPNDSRGRFSLSIGDVVF